MIEQALVMGSPGNRSVEEASEYLKRLYFVERETMRTLGGYLVSASDWELKKLLPEHLWQDSLRANALRTRVLEMRYPRRDVDSGHDSDLERFLGSLIRCTDDAELIAGVYFVTKQAVCEAYAAYLTDADPLDDAPTVAFMSGFIPQIREQITEADRLFSQLPESARQNSQAWRDALESYLPQIGGLTGKGPRPSGEGADVPSILAERAEYSPPLVPVRDPRFTPAKFHMPRRQPEKFIERQVFQGINHANEMWAAEIAALVMWTWNDMPWDFYLECSRWSYDEARHSMMGEQRLAAWGFQAGIDYAMIADHYMAVSDLGELAVLALLHAFETGGPAWKRGLKSEFEAAGDTSSSQDCDYDWADESIHLQYGHKWVLHRLGGDLDAMEDLKEECVNRWHEWITQKHTEWDYEPFLGRIEAKIKQIEQNHHG